MSIPPLTMHSFLLAALDRHSSHVWILHITILRLFFNPHEFILYVAWDSNLTPYLYFNWHIARVHILSRSPASCFHTGRHPMMMEVDQQTVNRFKHWLFLSVKILKVSASHFQIRDTAMLSSVIPLCPRTPGILQSNLVLTVHILLIQSHLCMVIDQISHSFLIEYRCIFCHTLKSCIY